MSIQDRPINLMPNGQEPEKTLHFRYGVLKNGNRPGNPLLSPRCGAKSKRTGLLCRQPAMKNGRCRLHGGLSTGPKTLTGLECSRNANWKHGIYSQVAKKEYQQIKAFLKNAMEIIKETNC